MVGFARIGLAEETFIPRETVQVEAEAERLTLDSDRDLIEAKGNVVLTSGALSIQARSLTLDLKRGFIDLNAPLIRQYRGLWIEGRRMTLQPPSYNFEIDSPRIAMTRTYGSSRVFVKGSKASCSEGRCVLLNAEGTACPHQPAGYHISAKQITVHPSGDIDLDRPVIYLGESPILAAPWLRIRPADKPGFLPPRVGWDRHGGLILGPGGYVPIGSNASAQGHFALRTSQGLETFSMLKTSDLELSIEHLFDAPENEARVRSHADPPLKGSNFVLDIDITTDRNVVDDLAKDPLERAVTHLSSRAMWSTIASGAVLESYVGLIQPLNDNEPFNRFLTPRTSIALALPSVPLAYFFWPSIDLRLTRIEAFETDLARDASTSVAPSHIRLECSPKIDIPLTLGPFVVDSRIASRHQEWIPDGAGQRTRVVHLLAAEADLSLPLARDLLSLWHTVTPYVRYRAVPWFHGSSPQWIVDDFDRLEKGHGIESGFFTEIHGRGDMRVVHLAVAERVELAGLGQETGPTYLAGSVGLGPPLARVVADGAWDHELRRPSTAGVTVSSHIEGHGSLEIEGRWIGPGRGPHLDYVWNTSSGPWIAEPWPIQPKEALELTERFTARIAPRVEGRIGARIGVWPVQSLNALWYGVELSSKCRCFAAGIAASHRPSTSIPDVIATLRLVQQ